MPLKKSTGNMYPWVDFTHTHLGGECSHKCTYCYVNSFPFGRPEKYRGHLRLIEKEFNVNYGSNVTIFIEHCNDLFAKDVPYEFISKIISHCCGFLTNTYVFQTKNPARFEDFLRDMPGERILGTTIETNRRMNTISNAPDPLERAYAMTKLSGRKFVTIEPVLDFDVDILAGWIAVIRPEFLNLGADSKNHGLPEPTIEKIMALVGKLQGYGIELREKHNLQRLKP